MIELTMLDGWYNCPKKTNCAKIKYAKLIKKLKIMLKKIDK